MERGLGRGLDTLMAKSKDLSNERRKLVPGAGTDSSRVPASWEEGQMTERFEEV